MVNSMTGFAALSGQGAGFSWSWELRAVNAKGLDLRLRVPDWIEGLEAGLRAQFAKAMARGSVTLSLRVTRDDSETPLALDPNQLSRVLEALARIEAEAVGQGLILRSTSAAEILNTKGVLDAKGPETDTKALFAALMPDAEPLLAAFLDMRAREGAVLLEVLSTQLNEIESLIGEAERSLGPRAEAQAESLRIGLARVLNETSSVEPGRLEQELALLAVKADITEEIDRLKAHVTSARELLARKEAVGRKLDFLCQEFNREANTLCSKSGAADLTRIGLDLKAVIEQMREQVQNVE